MRRSRRGTSEAGSWSGLGRPAEGLACHQEGETLAASAGLVGLGLKIAGERSFVLMMLGRVEDGVELALRTRERAQGLGLSGEAAFAGEQLVDAWRLQGRFDEADVLLEEIRDEGLPHHRWRCMRAEQLLARGDLEAAAALERETIALLEEVAPAGDPFHFVRQVDLFAALGDTDTVLAALARFFGDSVDADSPLELALCARGGYAALTAGRGAGQPVRHPARDGLRRPAPPCPGDDRRRSPERPCMPGRLTSLSPWPGSLTVSQQSRSGGSRRRRRCRSAPTTCCGRGSDWPRPCWPSASGTRVAPSSSTCGSPLTTWAHDGSRQRPPGRPGGPGSPCPWRSGCRAGWRH